MAYLLVYEQTSNTALDKEAALTEYKTLTENAHPVEKAGLQPSPEDRHEHAIRPYPELPKVSMPPPAMGFG